MGLTGRFLFKTDRRCLYKLVYNMGIKGALGFSRFQKRMKRGDDYFPAFTFISVTDDCNLHCQGCWVTGKKKNNRMAPGELDRIIAETKQKGSYFFGILGGEPLLYKPLFDIFRKHSDCYFQLFTNGTLLTPDVAEQLRQCANVTPLISFEGDREVADVRRGGKNVFASTVQAIENCTRAGLVTGVAISVCKSNFEMATSSGFIQSMIDKGVTYLWYYIFRPVGENASFELALSAAEIRALRQHTVEARDHYPLVIIDTYWDENGKAFCPAAVGLSHHINASGFVEPCPVIQLSTDHIAEKPMAQLYRDSVYLNSFRDSVNEKTRGCVVMEDPQWLSYFAEKHGAKDTSGRDNEWERLRTASVVPSHGSCDDIPERNRWYRLAKKHAFFGLGAYG